MAVMASLDIVLDEYKLSDAQKNAVIELLSGGFVDAKPNTIKSLEKKGLIIFSNGWAFEESFHAKLREGYSQPNYRTEDELAELNTNMWDDPEVTAEEVQAFKAMKDNLECEAPLADGVERFQDHWAMWEKELAGFGETLKWSNTQVWDGLTAEEIREDMDTEGPVNRTERRKAQRARRNFLRMVEGKGGRNRKQIKLCGGKG